jgi:hypothetical protein
MELKGRKKRETGENSVIRSIKNFTRQQILTSRYK